METFLEKHQSMVNALKIFLFCLLIIILASAFGLFKEDPMQVEISDEVFAIDFDGEEIVRFEKDEIESVELLGAFDKGEAVEPVTEDEYEAGIWENETFGKYVLYIAPSIEDYIVVCTADETYVFNYSDEESTQSMYNALMEW